MPVLVRSHPLPSSRIVHDRRAASSPLLSSPSSPHPEQNDRGCVLTCARTVAEPRFIREFSLSLPSFSFSRRLTHRHVHARVYYCTRFREFSATRKKRKKRFFFFFSLRILLVLSPAPRIVILTNIRTIRTYPPRIRLLNDLEPGRRIFHEMTVDVALNHPE